MNSESLSTFFVDVFNRMDQELAFCPTRGFLQIPKPKRGPSRENEDVWENQKAESPGSPRPGSQRKGSSLPGRLAAAAGAGPGEGEEGTVLYAVPLTGLRRDQESSPLSAPWPD